MIYNIAKHSLVYVDTDETTVDIPIGKLLDILDVSEAPVTTLSGSDKFVLQCDLGSRIHLSDIVYHFKSSSVPAGSVNILYKNEPFQDYTSLTSFADEEGYRTTLSGVLDDSPFAPRYLRLEHDLTAVSGTVSGTLHGFELLTDDKIVDFGSDGDATVSEFEVARGGLSQIQSVPIYNSGGSIVDALVCLEPTYTDVDDIISISTTPSGPWLYSRDQNNLVAGPSNFQNGVFDQTEVTDTRLVLHNYKDYDGDKTFRYEYGTYTTRIFYLDPLTQNRILIDADRSKGGYLTFDEDHLVETIEVRSSNAKPVDYSIYREVYQVYEGYYKKLSYRDRWTKDGSVKENHTWRFIQDSRYSDWRSYYLTMDVNTERTAGVVYHWSNDSDADSKVILINNIGTTAKSYTLSGKGSGSLVHTIRNVLLDVDGGVWIYFYAQTYSSSQFVNDTGYYLAYFDANLSNKFKYFINHDFIGDMSVEYTTGNLWYTYPGSETILKIDNEGETIYTITNEDTDFLGGITTISDNTVWYSNNGDLIHISATGSEIDKISDMLEDLEKYDRLAADPATTEAIWATWGFNVYRIFVAGPRRGSIDMSFNIEGALYIFPTKNGCWVWVADITGAGYNHMQYISKENRRVDLDVKVNEAYTTSTSEPSNSVFAPFEIDWQDEKYLYKMPVAIDNYWKDLEYTEVPLDNFILSEDDKYYQARVKFTRQPAHVRYNLPVDYDYINDDYFEQPDGPPQNTQLWGGWSGNDSVYVQDNKLILEGGKDAWIDTYKRLVVAGNYEFRWFFSVGDVHPVEGGEKNLYFYVYSADYSSRSVYHSLRIRFDTDGNAAIYSMNHAGSSSYDYLGWFSTQNVGCRFRKDGSYLRVQVWDGDSWEEERYHSYDWAPGTAYYARIYKPGYVPNVSVSSFQTVGGTPYYYSGSPEVRGIYTQESLKVNEIHPGTPKNVYVKAQVGLSKNVSQQEETQLRVKWRQPVS